MAVLVRHDVGLGEWPTLCPELGPELVEEPKVEVNMPVGRAVERSNLGRSQAAAAYAATAGVVDLRRIQGGIGPEGHGHHLGLVVRGQSSDAAARSGRPAPEGRYRRVVAFLAAADGA